MKLMFFFGFIDCSDFSLFHRKIPENARPMSETFSKFDFGFWKGDVLIEPNNDKNSQNPIGVDLEGFRARMYRRKLQSMIDNLTIGPGHNQIKTSNARYENAQKFTPKPNRHSLRRHLFKKYHHKK